MARDSGAVLETEAMVTGWAGERSLHVTSPRGVRTVTADAVVLATGARERPRPARLVPGDRPDAPRSTGGSARSACSPDARRAARAVRARAARRLARAGRRAHRGRARRARRRVVVLSLRRRRPVRLRARARRGRRAERARLDGSGTRITVPLAAGRPPANARLRRLVGQLVQLRPVLEDPARELWLELPGEGAQLVTLPAPEPDPERPLLVDEEIEVAAGVRARVIVRRAAEPIPLSPSRATRLGGLVIRSGRAAHETTLAGHEGEPGTRHLYGEVICDALEELQRAALDSPRPHVVVKVDRSGLNEHHPVVRQALRGDRARAAADRRRRGAPRRRASRPPRARGAGARPGRAARAQRRAARRVRRARRRRLRARRHTVGHARRRVDAGAASAPTVDRAPPSRPRDAALAGAMRFKQSPVRLHPGEDRGVSLRDRPGPGPARHAGRRDRRRRPAAQVLGRAIVPEPQPRAAGRA